MSDKERRKAYDSDLKKYGYVRQSTINRFPLEQETQEPIKRKSTAYLKRIRNDIKECGFITNDTVNKIVGYIPKQKRIQRERRQLKQKESQQ